MSKRTSAATAAGLLALAAAAACGSEQLTTGARGTEADSGASVTCPPCVTDEDCGGGICTQLGADSTCAPGCPGGNECTSDRACVQATSVTGEQVSVCVPRTDECGAVPSSSDAGGAPDAGACGSLVGPATKAACTSCTGRPSCQANGCYGGWWCDTATNRCQAPPSGCAAAGGSVDAGPAVTGQVTSTGGTLSRLLFAVVGDTRPGFIDDTAGYPSKVIQTIYEHLEAFAPHPPFVVTTGDYMFASTTRGQASPQLDLYLSAQSRFTGAAFPALGNHECTGATASNCGAGNADGVTDNYASFQRKMLAPIGKTDPWYAIRVDATDASWSAKLVFVAANAWSAVEASWLEGALAQATTYTFVVRHESASASTAPGVTPSEQIIARHPLTLKIVGHTHTYDHYASHEELVVGNGGAPLTGGKSYGFALLNQRPDGAVEVDMIDYATGQADASFRFAVRADGSQVAP